jgi:hypothetical protein
MDIAAHITFFYNEDRIRYLDKLLSNLEVIGQDHQVHVYLYINKYLVPNIRRGRVNVELIVTPYLDWRILRKFYRYLPWTMRQHVDPFYLTWKHRRVVLETLDRYDLQIYLEDDIDFTERSFQYWLDYKGICKRNGYIPGFIRVEFDERTNRRFCTDFEPSWVPDTLVEVDGLPFAISGQYYGLWIYEKEELKRFAQSGKWHLEGGGDNIRERAALGLHGVKHNMYKANIVPVEQAGENLYVICEECSVHHMPNNYIGHPRFCTLEFPPRIISEIGRG